MKTKKEKGSIFISRRTTTVLGLCVGLVLIISFFLYRQTKKPSYFYVEIKMGQGLWWAQTAKPTLWFVKAIKKGDKVEDLLGRTKAEILKVRYYPYDENQYNIYLLAKIQGKYNKSTKKYIFDNSPIAVGSPIELEFPSVQITGTIIDISDRPILEQYVEKTITFIKKYGYFWEKNAIFAGDSYFDGEETVFKVIGRTSQETNMLSPDELGNLTTETNETRNYITLKAKIKVRQKLGQYVYGGDQVIKVYSRLNLFTDRLNLSDYIIASIE